MRKRRAVGRIDGMKYGERAKETEIDTITEYKGMGRLGWFMSET